MTNTSIARLFEMTSQGIGKWKKEKRPIIAFIEKYLNDENIQEFLETGKIEKFENITFIVNKYLSQLQITYLNSFTESQSLLSEPHVNDRFKDFYFNFLANFGKIDFPFNINVLGIQSLLTHYLFVYQTQKIKENLKIDKINQKQKEDIFSKNKINFEEIMIHFYTFNSWNNDIYYFLELVKKNDFDYFINSKNDELLYQAIGYLIYSLSHNLDAEEKLQIIYSTFHYFIFNKDLISCKNVKEQILKRLENNKSFSEIDKEISHKYITSPFPNNNTNKFEFDIDSENKEIEIINFEDL